MIENFFINQSVIVTLDVDSLLFERLKQITQAGFSIIELNTSDGTVLKNVLNNFPNLYIGAGNITNTEQLEKCYQAGIHFITSPGFLPSLVNTAAIYAMNYIPGIATLSEAMQVMECGGRQARPYPAALSFCALLDKCLPELRLFPAEIEWNEAEHYLSIPAVSAVSIINPEYEQLNALTDAILA